jgi:hypothetical protein
MGGMQFRIGAGETVHRGHEVQCVAKCNLEC